MKTGNCFLSFISFGVSMILINSCKTDEPLISNSLDRLNWSDQNFTVLNRLVGDYGVCCSSYNEKKAPYAVLDWDQTCAHFDVEEATMRYQLTHLRFKLTKDQFKNNLL